LQGFLRERRDSNPRPSAWQRLAGVRAGSLAFAETSCLQPFGSGERTAANPDERSVQPLLPL
jgi:hypothetical protein